jgi:hypothetical protein
MEFKKHSFMLVVIVLTMLGCQSNPDFEKMRSEILDLHNALIYAHWNKDVDFFTKDISENYFSVGNGEIRRQTKSEIAERFTNYLNNTTFTEYKDLQEPVIGFSKDGSLAWSVVQVKVAGVREMDDKTKRDFDYTFAWITLYEKQEDKWIRLGEASNSK